MKAAVVLFLSLTVMACGHHYSHEVSKVSASADASGFRMTGEIRCRVVGVPSCEETCPKVKIFANPNGDELCPSNLAFFEATVAPLATVESCFGESMAPNQVKTFTLESSEAFFDDVFVVLSGRNEMCFSGSGKLLRTDFAGGEVTDPKIEHPSSVFSVGLTVADEAGTVSLAVDYGCAATARLSMNVSYGGATCSSSYDLTDAEQTSLELLLGSVRAKGDLVYDEEGEGGDMTRERTFEVGYACNTTPPVTQKKQVFTPTLNARVDSKWHYPAEASSATYVTSGNKDVLAFFHQLALAQAVGGSCSAEWASLLN